MKAFVIKNKEGEYLEEGKDMYGEDTIIWHKDIVYADIYSSKGIAEMKLEPFYRDCEVVEVTIAEGDLEQQLDKAEQELAFYEDEIKNRGTCGLCEKLENEQIKKLEQQLKEKDKKIEKLDIMIKTLPNHDAEIEQLIRKQVCGEIKEYMAKEYGISVEDMPTYYHSLAWSVKDIYELLDRIEQAKESMK